MVPMETGAMIRMFTHVTRAALLASLYAGYALAAEVGSIPPAAVEITSLKNVAVVPVEQPVKVRGWQLYVDKNTYEYMVKVTAEADGLHISPTDQAEVGTYDLVVDTDRGPIRIALNLSLREEEGLLERNTTELGNKDAAMHATGLTTVVPHETVTYTLGVQPQYKPGDTMVVSAPEDGKTEVYRWVVNNDTIVEQQRLEYAFPKEGEYVVRLERRDPSGGWVKVSETNTLVTSSAAVTMEAKVGQRINFTGPAGFSAYEWSHGGTVISRALEATIKFDTPGVYNVYCRAQQPVSQPGTDYVMVRYEVTVQ